MEIAVLLGIIVLATVIAGSLSKTGKRPQNQAIPDRSETTANFAPSRSRRQHPQSQPQHYPPIPESLTITGRAYVIDGDTIIVKGTKIRLAGVDAPELHMPWGRKSKWAMVAICKNQTITVHLDGERSFDRLVGTCCLQDGRDIGAELVKQGLALDLTHFSGGKYRQFEPEGARRKLANGRFGHFSLNRPYRAKNRAH